MAKDKKPDFGALERKLSAGKPLSLAAEEAGMPLQEAEKWLEEQRYRAVYDDDALRLAAAEALHYGLTALIWASQQHDGRIGMSGDANHGGMTSMQYPDNDAAKALLAFSLNARKMLRPKDKKESTGNDLFDSFSGTVTGAWTFKDTEG